MQVHKRVTVLLRDRMWVRFLLEEIKYFIFNFFRSVDVAKRGVGFRNAYRIRWKMESELSKTPFETSPLIHAEYSVNTDSVTE